MKRSYKKAAFTSEDLVYSNILNNNDKYDRHFEKLKPGDVVPRFEKFCDAIKSYKGRCENPNVTTKKIIRILRNFFYETDFNIIHSSFMSTCGISWSLSVCLYAGFIPIIEQGGKSIDIEYALASAYGELIERIQSGHLFSINPEKLRLVYFNNNQKTSQLTDQEISDIKINNNHIRNRIGNLFENNPEEIEYINLTRGDVTLVPKFLVDSKTGEAAGNNYEEAFLHAFYEIIERYCSSEILTKKIKSPTVSSDMLNKENRKIVLTLKDNGYETIIKDSSLHLPFSCIALVIYDAKDYSNKNLSSCPKNVIFAAGSDIDTCFERCISEFFQICPDISNRYELNKKIVNGIKLLYNLFPEVEKSYPRNKIYIDEFFNRGCYPSDELEFLFENYGEYINKNTNCENIIHEIELVLNYCENNDISIYYRDNNWLGYPTIKLFIPKYSILNTPFNDEMFTGIKCEVRNVKNNIRGMTNSKLFNFEIPELLLYSYGRKNLASFFKIETEGLTLFSTWKFISLVMLRNNQVDNAQKFETLNCYYSGEKLDNINCLGKNNERNELRELDAIVPDCSRPCRFCHLKEGCKHYLLKNLEESVSKKHKKIFKYI